MRLGYNTNGFAHHRPADALTILARLGYEAVGITLERAHLDPPDRSGVDSCVRLFAPLIESTGLKPTIETGARFILDPWEKHQPTLLSADPARARRRTAFLLAAIDVAAALEAESVSLWSGTPDDAVDDEEVLWDRLIRRLGVVLDHADKQGVRLAFEPEPGMFIDTMSRFAALYERLPHPQLGLTIDVGHLVCLGDGRLLDHARRWRTRLWNVHIEDMRRGRHEHLMFGDGEVDLPAVIRALRSIDYVGPVHVELSRHSHMAVEAARRSLDVLRAALEDAGAG